MILAFVNVNAQEMAGSYDPLKHPKATFSIKTAPIRYIYGGNIEVEFALSRKWSVGMGVQDLQRDFVLPTEQYSSQQVFYHFSMYEGSGNRIFVDARYYTFRPSKFHTYVNFRLYAKNFDFRDTLAKRGDDVNDYFIEYEEDQRTYGLQALWGAKYTDKIGSSPFFYEMEAYAGVGLFYMERRTEVVVPDNLFSNPETRREFETLFYPQFTVGLLLGLGM